MSPRKDKDSYREYMRNYMADKRLGLTGINNTTEARKLVGAGRFELPTSWSRTPTFETKRLTDFAKLINEYIADRVNIRGITENSRKGIEGYFRKLLEAFPDRFPSRSDIVDYLGNKKPVVKRRTYEALRAFGNWLEKHQIMPNPWKGIDVPKVPIPLLPAPSPDQINQLFNYLDEHYPPDTCLRNKTIIATLVESGLRLSEIAGVHLKDINWQQHTIQVWGKGNKEGLAPFGSTSETLLKQWLSQYNLEGNIWGINKNGIQTMLKRLKAETGIPCTAHNFRRAFASILRRSGVDVMTIKDLGRWESLEMVQRYTRSVTFQDSLKHYKAPLGDKKED